MLIVLPSSTNPRTNNVATNTPKKLKAVLFFQPFKFGVLAAFFTISEFHKTAVSPMKATPNTNQTTRSLLINERDRKSTRLNSSHVRISYAVFCLKKKK